MTNFAHLHLHTEFSQLDGLGIAKQYAQEAKRLGQTHISITDHGNIDGVIKFQNACKKENITPILGCELYVCQDIKVRDNQRFHLVALVRSREGLTNLMQMLSLANLEGFYKRPRIDPSILLPRTGGLVFLTACVGSFINMSGSEDLLLKLRDQAPTFLEIMPHAHPKQKEHNIKVYNLGRKHNIPLVATNDCHYPYPGMEATQEVLLAMQRKAKWSDPDRWHMRDWPGLHLRSDEEMIEAFIKQDCLGRGFWEDAMCRTMEVAALCNGYTVERLPVELPKVHGHADRDETELMWEIISDGWSRREMLPDRGAEYEARVNEEFELICRQEFQRYFLIVWELINWCKIQGIMVGPGRGSSGGSLVAYLMGITDVDPIRYDLIFARFISPERRDYPDIDMDFEDSRRDEVRQHLRDCYGEHNVAGLSTFLTMKGKAALRGVARVFEVPGKEVDLAAKAIMTVPDGHDRANHTIEDSLKTPELAGFQRGFPDIVRHARSLEGQIHASGQHAAAVCISANDLRDGLRCNLVMRSGTLVANWDKDMAEHMGLMKLDVLGLSALSILNGARRMIRDNYGVDIEFDRLSLDDPEVYREIAAGNTAGAFQIGSALNTRYCRDLGVREFNDIVLINALTRPGPMGAGTTEQFLRRRKGQERVTYIHPRLKPYTKESLGLIIFQEQVMWAMYELAGLSWGECDRVRKVIGKSKGASAFLEFKQRFIDGCQAQGTLSSTDADHVWDQLASFGGYGFVKAHAVEYSMIGYWTMYCKCRWPVEFLAACLTWGGKDEQAAYVDEARRLGITIELPKQGVSLADRWMPKDEALWAPLTAIKGVGDHQAQMIISGKVKDSPQVNNKKKEQSGPVQRGFFDKKTLTATEPREQAPRPNGGNKTTELLARAGYYRQGPMGYEELKQAVGLYDFNILTGGERWSRLGDVQGYSDQDIQSCRLPGYRGNLIKIGRYILPEITCRDCGLIDECTKPVQPSFGRYNIMGVGEGPGEKEDLAGIGFVGPAGNDVLWPELAKYGIAPEMLHVTNVVKCWPSKTKTPSKAHIAACSRHLEAEIAGLRPVVILAMGNTGVQFFRGESGGITTLVRECPTEWSDRYQCWICWSVHPAAVLRNPRENRENFEAGIANFSRVLATIGGRAWAGDTWQDPGVCPYGGRWAEDNGRFALCGECPLWERCARAVGKSDWLGLG